MVVKIIGTEYNVVKTTTCKNCASILEYTNADTFIEKQTNYIDGIAGIKVLVDIRSLVCPNCITVIKLNAEYE